MEEKTKVILNLKHHKKGFIVTEFEELWQRL